MQPVKFGRLAEWFMALAWKASGCNSPVGSNPAFSAQNASMVELVYTSDLKSDAARIEGSIPSRGTIRLEVWVCLELKGADEAGKVTG